MKQNSIFAIGLYCLISCSLALADVSRSEANNGNLVMEDIPAIPQSVVGGPQPLPERPVGGIPGLDPGQ